ncbi:hypothetical protein DLE60_08530 [Micromonospora globispora]|uniref:hypothetical protein n=1 Tax=Micromonospora globispora TaxID=1450148 RepID=UPI000D6FF879|nr:hypothetical protein [Micromonospora globispora]PWU60912.1 hypothetical protein DLE60_08530 [Micromonospora globispora]RQW99183.1 hypothetical protein DKL51_08905 [Micromonospora globispora]
MPRQISAPTERIWNADAVTLSSIEISHDVEAIQVPQLMDLFASAWWATRRTESETRGILAGSDVVVTAIDRASGDWSALPGC